jgi:hypothetical protein
MLGGFMTQEIELISLNDAVEKKITRLRSPKWADPLDHFRIDLLPDGSLGPFLHQYGPSNEAVNGRDPVSVFLIGFDRSSKSFVPYVGPTPDSVEYKAKVAECNEYFNS